MHKINTLRKRIFFYCCVAMPLMVVLAAFFVIHPQFLTNDDASIQSILSGSITGQPYPHHQFINIFSGRFFCFFYERMPKIQWWFITEMASVFLGAFLFNVTLICVFMSKKQSVESSFFLGLSLFLFNFVLLFFNMMLPSFTVSPIILGGGIIAMLVSDRRYKNIFALRFIASVIVLLTFLIRQKSGLCVYCFYCVALLFHCMKASCSAGCFRAFTFHKTFKSFCVFAIPLLATLLIFWKVSAIDYEKVNGADFAAFNAARVRYTDYPHIKYDDNPILFEDFGVSKQKSELISYWCFMDKSVTTEFFKTIVDAKPSDDSANELLEFPKKTPENPNGLIFSFNEASVVNQIKKSKSKIQLFFDFPVVKVFCRFSYRQCIMSLAVFLSLVPVLLILMQRQCKNILFLASLLSTVGMWIFILYLNLIKRAIDRALLCCIIPAFCLNFIFLFMEKDDFKKLFAKAWKKILCFSLLFLFCFIICCSAVKSACEVNLRKREYGKITGAMFDVAESRKNDIFVSDFSFSSFLVNRNLPDNLLYWGGSTFYSDAHKKHLKRLGLQKQDMDVFAKENVYFLSRNIGAIELLYNVLYSSYGYTMAECTPIESIRGFIVKFSANKSIDEKYLPLFSEKPVTIYDGGKIKSNYIIDFFQNGSHWDNVYESFGIYEDKWIQPESMFIVNVSSTPSVLEFSFYNPAETIEGENTLEISVGDGPVKITPIRNGLWTESIKIEKKGLLPVSLKTDYQQKVSNGDKRHLSVILSDVRVK